MSERLDIFLKSVTDYADTQCTKLQKTAETQTQKEIIAYKKQATESSRANTNRELSKIKSNAANKASQYESEKRIAFMTLRKELSNSVFDDVMAKLKDFTLTKEYEDFLKRSAESLKEAIGEEIIFYLRADDIKHKDILQKVVPNSEIRESKKIRFGGIIATDKNETLRADDTLDSRLSMAKDTFFENPEFKIF